MNFIKKMKTKKVDIFSESDELTNSSLNCSSSSCDDSEVVDLDAKTIYLKGKSFPVHDIFKLLIYRNKFILIVIADENMGEIFMDKLKQGSGCIVERAIIKNPELVQHSLRNACRSLATHMLTNRLKVLIICDLIDQCNKSDMLRLSCAFSGGLLWLKGLVFNEQMRRLSDLVSNSPKKMIPSMSNKIAVSSLYNKTEYSSLTSAESLFQYTKYMRHSILGFSALYLWITQTNSGQAPGVISIVGYNPEYVEAGLLHGYRVKFYDVDQRYDDDSILPDVVGKNGKTVKIGGRITSEWRMPDSQRKLNQIDGAMFMCSYNVIYIGSYPATHLHNYKLHNWKLICIDPAITQENMNALKKVCNQVVFIVDNFRFTPSDLEGLIVNHQITGDCVIIDDSYDTRGGLSYAHMQEVKLDFAERVLSRENIAGCVIKAISLKFNFRSDRNLKFVKMLLPQPFGGDLDEMRLVLTQDGTDYDYRYASKVKPYLERFHQTSIADKLSVIRHFHRLSITVTDVLKPPLQSDDLTIALFSITNLNNARNDVCKYLTVNYVGRKLILFNVPNKGRIDYLLKNKINPGINLSLKGDVITFKSPTGKVWKDRCYTGKEMHDLGYIQITAEMMSGLLGPWYRGVGYMDNSAYVDMFNLYIPSFLFDMFFRFQHVATGPISFVKSMTTTIRNILPGLPQSLYYKLRGTLAMEIFQAYGVNNRSYTFMGDPECSVRIIDDVYFETEFGIVDVKATIDKPVDIGVSGHLLSLSIMSHFVPVALDAWMKNLITMSKKRSINDISNYLHVGDVLLFDNKMDEDGTHFKPWHTMNELIITILLLERYTAIIMSGNYSRIIIDDIKSSFKQILSTYSYKSC